MTALARPSDTGVVPRSEEWHAIRRTGIGASDVAAICGMSSYAAPINIWEEKVGIAAPRPDTDQAEWGRRLEPIVLAAAAERVGKIRRISRERRWPEWPVLFAHLDATSAAGPIEAKTAMNTRGWGLDGSSEVPPHVALQLQTQLLCTGRPRGFVAALIGYRDFRLFEIERDDDLLLGQVVPLLQEFWALVESRTPPAPDGSESYGAFLRRMFPRDDRTDRVATPEEGLLVADLIEASHAREAAKKAEDLLEQRVQLAIDDSGGLVGPGWRISYRAARETDWHAVAADLAPSAELVEQHTKPDWRAIAKALKPKAAVIDAHSTHTGSRRFLLTEEESF